MKPPDNTNFEQYVMSILIPSKMWPSLSERGVTEPFNNTNPEQDVMSAQWEGSDGAI